MGEPVQAPQVVITVELTANQLHAQSAGLATHHGHHTDVLGHDGGVEHVGLGAVIIHVTHKHLGTQEGTPDYSAAANDRGGRREGHGKQTLDGTDCVS